jgi:hypothetical protein
MVDVDSLSLSDLVPRGIVFLPVADGDGQEEVLVVIV